MRLAVSLVANGACQSHFEPGERGSLGAVRICLTECAAAARKV